MAEHERIDPGRAGGAAFQIGMKIAAARTDRLDPHNHLVRRRRWCGDIGDADVSDVVEDRCAHVQTP